MLEDMVHAVEDVLGMSGQLVVEVVVNHTVFLQNLEHMANSGLVVGSSMVDDGVKSVYQMHMGDLLVHVTLIEG